MFRSCIPENIRGIALPFAVLGIAVNLLCPDVTLLDQTHEPTMTAHDTLRVPQAERHPIHDPHDGLIAFQGLYVITRHHKVQLLLSLISLY